MAKLPFSDFEGSAHYRVTRDVLTLRYRFPGMEKFRLKSSRFRASRHEKRPFFAWARAFLRSGGEIDAAPDQTLGAEDQRELTRLDESLTIGDAIRLYLEHCETGNSWMRPKSPVTLRGVTRPWLTKFAERFGPSTPLGAVQPEAIAAWLRGQGGRKETKQRRLSPISNMYSWAKRERYVTGDNPCHGIVFWREPTERPHDSTRTFYTTEELETLLAAAARDPFAADGIVLCRYLALRPADAAELRWEDFKWDALLVQVRRKKTRHTGVEVSPVEMHPVIAERFASRRGETGWCLTHGRRSTKIVWPSQAELKAMVDRDGYVKTGKALGVSNNAVKKRLQRTPTELQLERSGVAESLSSRIGRITKKAGLYEKGVQPCYVLRHTFASENLRQGVPPAIVAKEMGISVDTLMKYYFHMIPRGELDDRRSNRWGLTRDDVDSAGG